MRRSILAVAAIAASIAVAMAVLAAVSTDDGATDVLPAEPPAAPDDAPGIPDTPGTEAPDTDTPDVEIPDTDTEAPGTEAPDTDTPGTEAPDTDTPDVEIPDTDTEAPGTEAPDTDTPGTGTPDDVPDVPDTPDVETPDDVPDVPDTPDVETPDDVPDVPDTPGTETPDADDMPPVAAVIPEEIATANNAFAADFYGQISADPDNIFFSPTSMYAAFSVLYEGAGSDTATQMQDTFGFEPDRAARHAAAASMLASVNRDDQYATLDMANALWLANWFAPYDSYLDTARNVYVASVETLDFTEVGDDGEKTSVKRINDWASENTNGKIDQVITDDAVDVLTAMVINNAIYFNGTWVTQFPVEDTEESDFYKSGAESVSADFMNVEAEFDYASTDDVQVLRMPYKGDRLSMLVVLPHDVDGIGQLEKSLSAGQMERWMAGLESQEVTVSVPKFEFKTRYDLKEPLMSMGMTDVFVPSASDLSGVANLAEIGENLYVSKATQDAYVNVNEEGTEAAAVTTVTVTIESFQPPPPSFIADHPFIFTIYDEESGMILFMGRVSDPS